MSRVGRSELGLRGTAYVAPNPPFAAIFVIVTVMVNGNILFSLTIFVIVIAHDRNTTVAVYSLARSEI